MQWLEKAGDNLTQGSIIDGVDWGMGTENPLSLVITNACDFEHDKCGYINVLALESAEDVISCTKEYQGFVMNANGAKEMTTKAWSSLMHYLESIIYNQNIIRYYFFDTMPVIDAGLLVADFQQIQSLPYSKKSSFELVAKLSSPFIEQLMIHYISYTGRIPSERIDEEARNKYIETLVCGYRKREVL